MGASRRLRFVRGRGDSTPMGFVIRMLGGFQVDYEGATVLDAGWRPAKAAAIVKALALQSGRTLHRDRLIELLWPEAEPQAGSSSFYKNMHHLRAALRGAGAPALVTLHRGAVSLAEDISVDADVFRDLAARALATGDTALFGEALRVPGGDLLPGDLYEPWTEPHREDLRDLRLAIELGLADRHLRRHHYDDAIHLYHQALLASPLSEEAHRGLMRAYAMDGHREQALAQYQRCRDLFRAELDAAPSDETEVLLAEIQSLGRLLSPVDLAIEEPVREAEAAMRRRDWAAATGHYRVAIENLHAAGADDEREGELWLDLSVAASAIAGTQDLADYARRAATLGARAGSLELESRALVQFQAATDALPNNHPGHRESAELIQAALVRCPDGPSASRARLLAAGARPLAASARPADERHVTGRVSIAGHIDPEIEAILREAVATARAVRDPAVLSYALTRLRVYITSPDTLEERVAITAELAELQESASNAVSRYEAHLMRHEDLLEAGDIDGARIEARAIKRVGDIVGAGGFISAGLSCLATHATADGDLGQALSLLFASREADAAYGNNSNSQYRFGIQVLVIRWHQGRIGELYEAYVRAVDLAPRLNAPRASLALICAETGRLPEAREHLARLTGESVSAIPRDFFWWLTCIFMSHAAIAAGDSALAADLYDMLMPFADRNPSASGAVSFGSADFHLARLAEFGGEQEKAARHYERALEFNVRTRQRTWAAHTRHHYARLLAARADSTRAADLARIAEADAREIGIRFAPDIG